MEFRPGILPHRIGRDTLLRGDVGRGLRHQHVAFHQLRQTGGIPRQGVRLDLLVRHPLHDHRRPAGPLPLLRDGLLPLEPRADTQHPPGGARQPRSRHRPARGTLALLPPEPDALPLVARPDHGRRGDQRGLRPAGQPLQFGDLRHRNRLAVGVRLPAGRRDRAQAPHADLRGALLPGHLLRPAVALLRPRPGPPKARVHVRAGRLPHLRLAFLHRVHQKPAGGVRAEHVPAHGPVAQHTVYPAGYRHDGVGPAPSGPGAAAKKRR